MTYLHYPNLTSESEVLYQLEDIGKDFFGNAEMVTVLNNVNLTIKKGETVSIMGASGSGKSSFLQILGGLASPSRGKIFFKGKDFSQTTVDEKATLRNKFIGFVFQFHYLLPEFTTLENIAIPAMISGVSRKKSLEEALVVLEQVGLAERKNFNVTLLSGGERQRVAIARALLCKPLVLLADEPTGNLDQQNSHIIADLLLRLNDVYKMSIVMVTHNHELATRMGRCFELKSGDLYDQTC